MKTRQELTEILDFIADYATYLLASGVHTSRVIRNSQRIGQSQGVDIQLSSFQKSTILTVRDDATGEAVTRVVKIPALPISFERNSDLSSLSWEAVDRRLPLDVIREKFRKLTAKPRMDPMFVLMVVGLANASFCKLFNGDWVAVGIVRLHGRDGHRHERAVPRSGRAAHQRRDRHRRGARADRLQPSDRRPAADPLHRRGAVRHVVNG